MVDSVQILSLFLYHVHLPTSHQLWIHNISEGIEFVRVRCLWLRLVDRQYSYRIEGITLFYDQITIKVKVVSNLTNFCAIVQLFRNHVPLRANQLYSQLEFVTIFYIAKLFSCLHISCSNVQKRSTRFGDKWI